MRGEYAGMYEMHVWTNQWTKYIRDLALDKCMRGQDAGVDQMHVWTNAWTKHNRDLALDKTRAWTNADACVDKTQALEVRASQDNKGPDVIYFISFEVN